MRTPKSFLCPPHDRLNALHTALGKRSLYESVSYCNRCGCCAQSCPAYRLNPQEIYSPRGRNQVLRLALERKIKLNAKDPVLRRLLETCTLCGRCTQVCPGLIPTAEHVLEMRRALHLRTLPGMLFSFLQLRETRPKLFEFLARTGLVFRQTGLVKLLRFSGLTYLLGVTWLNHLDSILPSHTPNLRRYLRRKNVKLADGNPSLIYLPSLEAQFILPQLAYHTLHCARKKHSVTVWLNTPSGLFSYVYGDLRQSRRTLRRLISRHAQISSGNLPLLTDSIDVYHFLKRAPELFDGNPHWEKQAEQLANCVRFVTDIFPPASDFEDTIPAPVQLEYSALLDRQSPPIKQAETILYTFFGKNFVECLYTDADVPAFGYAFTQKKHATQISAEVVARIERTQPKTVFTLSGLSALELSYWLRRFYPAAQVKHLVEIIR